MASEELQDVQELIKLSRSPRDSGPFYHHSFWEAYKGSLKGKLGGAIIGTSIGMVVGLLGGLVGLVAIAPTATVFFGIAGGITAAGMLYGAKEFGDSGRMAGAVAAAHKDGERRLMAFEKSQFAELKQEISDIKSMLGDKSQAAAPKNDIDMKKVEGELEKYRKKHFSDNFPHLKQLISWKVVVIGLAIGILAGWGFGLLGTGPIGAILEALHLTNIAGSTAAATGAAAGAAAEAAAATAAAAETATVATGIGGISTKVLAAMIGLGAVGASFGINRDLFRKVFDVTDGWFKGIYNYGKKMGTELAPQAPEIDINRRVEPQVSTIIYPDAHEDSPSSDTLNRGEGLFAARVALQALNPANSRSH